MQILTSTLSEEATPSFPVLSTSVDESQDSVPVEASPFATSFLEEMSKSAKKYLGIQANYGPDIGNTSRLLVYRASDLKTTDISALSKSLKEFYASAILAHQGISFSEQDASEVEELSKRSKIRVTNLRDNAHQINLWDADAEFEVRITTNDAVIVIVER